MVKICVECLKKCNTAKDTLPLTSFKIFPPAFILKIKELNQEVFRGLSTVKIPLTLNTLIPEAVVEVLFPECLYRCDLKTVQ